MIRRLIVFDWNGTLLSDTIPSWKAANVCLDFYGMTPITLQRYRETFTFPVIHFYKLNGCDVDTVLVKKSEANMIFQNAYESLAAKSRMRAGGRQILTWLHKNNIPAIILSNYLTDKIEWQLKRLGVAQFFEFVSAHDDDGTKILEHTTKTGRLADYMKAHGYAAENTVIIGDTMEEPQIGRDLNVASVGLTDGYITERRLREAKPAHIIHNLRDLRPLLIQKWGLPS